jgi:hypothetical protein
MSLESCLEVPEIYFLVFPPFTFKQDFFTEPALRNFELGDTLDSSRLMILEKLSPRNQLFSNSPFVFRITWESKMSPISIVEFLPVSLLFYRRLKLLYLRIEFEVFEFIS